MLAFLPPRVFPLTLAIYERLPVYQIVRKPYLCLEGNRAESGFIKFINVRKNWTSFTFENEHGRTFRFNTLSGTWRYVGDDLEMRIPEVGVYVIYGVKTSA